MKTISKFVTGASAAFAILASSSLFALAQAPIVIKFSHVVAPDTPKGKGAQKFQELAEKYTGGKVKVEVYPNSQLYKDKEELEALQLGAVQMLAPASRKFGPLGAREFEVFDLPFIFPDKAALRKVTDGEVGKAMFAKLETKGITGLAYWDNGFKIMSANREIKKPDDMLGLKIRIQSSKVLEAQIKALGAIPQVMAFSEVYQALADRRCRRPGEHAVEHVHAENARSSDAYRAHQPRLHRLRRDREQEILGWHPRRISVVSSTRRWRKPPPIPTPSPRRRTTTRSTTCARPARRKSTRSAEAEQEGLARGAAAGPQGNGGPHRQGNGRCRLQGNRHPHQLMRCRLRPAVRPAGRRAS